MTEIARAWAALPQVTNIHSSANGRWAFWCWGGLDEVENVWCAPLDGSAPPRRLTRGRDHFLIRDVSADGTRLVLAQSRNASEHDHLWLLAWGDAAEAGGFTPPAPPVDYLNKEEGEAGVRLVRLTPEQDCHYLYGGVFAPDGGSVIFVADFDYGAGQVTAGGWVWRLDLATGVLRCLARSATPFERGVAVSPDGAQLLWHRHERAPAGTQLWVMGLEGEGLREVLNLGPANAVRGEWIAPGQVAFVADHEGRDRLGVLEVATGQVRWLGGEPEMLPFAVVPGGEAGSFALITHDASHSRAMVYDARGRHMLVNRSGRRSLLPHAGLPGGAWLCEAYDADAPHEIVLVQADGRCQSIARGPEDGLRRHSRPQSFAWTSVDGRAVQGWLYVPQGPVRGLIAYVHGGPTWHSEDWVNPKIGFWVQSGYAVLDPNYRGSTGFGHDWREAVKEDGWGGREQADIRAGIEAVLSTGIPGPVAVAGNSYGGFSSWYALTRHADLVAAAIPMCGMYRLDIDYHETEMPHGRAYSEEMMGGTPEEFPEKYANASPGNFIHQIRGQVMIVHGLADSNVGPENTHAAVRELTAAGIPHEVLLFADEGHGVFRRSNVETYLAHSLAFLDRALNRRNV